MAGSRIKGITIEIDGSTKALSAALKGVNNDLIKTQSRLSDVQRLLRLDPTNTELIGQKYRELQNKIAATETKLKSLKEASAQAEKQLAAGEISQEKYDALQREIIKTEQDLKKLMNTVGSGNARLAEMSAKAEHLGNSLKNAGSKLMPLSLGFAAAGAAAGRAAVDFESAFTGVTKTVDGTSEQMERIKQGILDLSQSTASSASDIAAVAAAAGQLGIKTNDIMSFTKTMIMLGDSTNLSAEEAASALAKFANITGTAASEYSKLGSVIVDLGNNYATTEADIVAMSTRLASSGSLAGLTEPQILALATAMNSVGIEAEAGGSAMSKLIKMMQVAVETGGSKLQQFASVAGMTGKEFSNAFERDAVAAMGAFISGLNDTERNGKSAIATLDEMGLTEIRLSNTILSLASSGDLMTDAISTANNAWDKNNALTKEAEKRYETTAAKLQQLKNSGTEIAVTLGDSFLPVLQDVAETVKDGANAISKMPKPIKTMTSSLILLGAASGPVLSGIGSMSLGLGALTGHFSKASVQAGKTSAISKRLSSASSGLFGVLKANPYTAVAAAAAGMALAVYKGVESTRQATIAAGEYSESNNKSIASIETASEKASFYASKLDELVAKEAKSAQDKEMIKRYVDILNESIDGLNLKYDEETGKLNENTKAIDRKVKAMREEAMASAYIEQSKKALDKATASQMKLAEAQEHMKDAQAAYDKAASSGYVSQKLSADLAQAKAGYKDLKSATAIYWQEYTKQSNMAAMQSGQWDALVEEAKGAGVQIPKSLTDGIKAGNLVIPSSMKELKALIKFDDLATKAGGAANETVRSLSQKLRDGTITASEAAKALANAADKPLQAEAGSAGNAGKKTGKEYSKGIEGQQGEARVAGEAVGNRALNAMKSVKGAQQAGKNMGLGFKDGLRSSIDAVAKAGAAIAQAALEAAKKKSRQKSPSRAWFESGQMDIKGYTNALEAQLPGVRKAGMNIAAAALTGANGTAIGSMNQGMQAMLPQIVSNLDYSQMRAAFSSALNRMEFAIVLDQRELGRGLQGMGVQFR